jgi:hypothetical protein
MNDITLFAQHAAPVAYLDGGTGSMLLQAGLAGALTAAYFVKSQWAHLKAVVARPNPRRVTK